MNKKKTSETKKNRVAEQSAGAAMAKHKAAPEGIMNLVRAAESMDPSSFRFDEKTKKKIEGADLFCASQEAEGSGTFEKFAPSDSRLSKKGWE